MKLRDIEFTEFDTVVQLTKVEYDRIRHRENAKFSRLKPKGAKRTYTYEYARRKQLISKHTLTFPPYDLALQIVSRIPTIQNKKTYNKWHKENKITHLPAMPDIHYDTEWESWSMWCVSEPDDNAKQYVPIHDAMKWVHTLRLPNKSAWVKYCRGNVLPDGIPPNPNHVYSDWKSWIAWLGEGTLVQDRAPSEQKQTIIKETKQEIKKVEQAQEFIFVTWENNDPNNIFTQVTLHSYLDAVALFNRSRMPNSNIRLLASVDVSKSEDLIRYQRIIDQHSARHPTVPSKRKVSNWHGLKQQLDQYVTKFELKINTIKQ